jgi:hypothetical protein
MFSGATSTNTLNLNDNTIYGRYYLNSDMCVRFNLDLDNGTDITKFFVQDDASVSADPLSRDKVEDKRTRRDVDWTFNVGIQKSRGYGRLQGFYGATIGFGQERTSYSYEYGNVMAEANQQPTTVTNWNNGNSSNQAIRTTELDEGLWNRISVGPIAGIEYYFAPKICLGAEVSILYFHTWETESDYAFEEWANGEVTKSTVEVNPNYVDRNIDSYGLGSYGGLYLMFHF